MSNLTPKGYNALELMRFSAELLEVRASLESGGLNPIEQVRASARGLELRAILEAKLPEATADPLEQERDAAKDELTKHDRLINMGAISPEAYAAIDRYSAAVKAINDRDAAAVWEAAKQRPIATANNKPHTIKKVDALTPAGMLKADAINSRADGSVWYYQGDVSSLSLTASVKINGQESAGAGAARIILAGLKSAKDRGYKLYSYRAGRLGTVWVLEGDKEVFLSRAGFEDGANPVFERPDMPPSEPGYDSMRAQQTALAKQFVSWLDTLPYGQRHNQGVVSRKMGVTPVGEWARMSKEPLGLTLTYRHKGGGDGIRVTGNDFDALVTELRQLAVMPEIEPVEPEPAAEPPALTPESVDDADQYAAKAVGFPTFSDYAASRIDKLPSREFQVARAKYKIVEYLEQHGRADRNTLGSLEMQGANAEGPSALSQLRQEGVILNNLRAKSDPFSLAPGVTLATFVSGQSNPAPLAEPALEPAKLIEPVPPAPEVPHEIIEYVTKGGKGKTLRGIIRTDLTKDEAKAIDPYTWRMNGGYFIREKHLGVETSHIQAAPVPVVLSPEQLAERQATAERDAAERAQKALANQVEKLRTVASKAVDSGSEGMNRDRTTNTARRAGMAASAIARASYDKAAGETLNNIADAIENGSGGLLTKLTSRAQLEELQKALRLAQYETDRHLTYSEQLARKGRPIDDNDIKNVAMPSLLTWSSRFRDASLAIAKHNPKGNSRLIAALAKIGQRAERFTMSSEDMAIARKGNDALKGTRDSHLLQAPMEAIAQVDRLARMGITEAATLREATRELLPMMVAKAEESAVKKAERAIIGQKVGIDFFPTPANVAQRMARLAGITQDMRVLEPSAGNGNLADAAKSAGGVVDVIEISSQLRDILTAKGYSVVAQDFDTFTPDQPYQAILMNPPFSKRQDAAHIMRAFGMLASGGKLVAIAGEGVFFGSDQKAVAFRAWLESHNATIEKLDGGTFQDKNLLAQTGANARLIILKK